jgi:ABC-type transporter Mla maintaining outer membrane lipid asymmetry ATPase subunit MlaF
VQGARKFSDRAIVLQEGKILTEGSFADLQKSEDPFVSQFLGYGSG